MLAADDAIESVLEVAHSLVEQFLPEVAQPLRERCGEICKVKPLYDQLNTFQDNLLPPEDVDEAVKRHVSETSRHSASQLSEGSRFDTSKPLA